MREFIPSLVSKYEVVEEDLDAGASGCEGGVCPIR
jgi:ribonucleoside-diphosphate reductase alpha chain/ribonucleoside-triphosphate reductase